MQKKPQNAATTTETDGSPMKQAPCVDLKCGDSTPQFLSVFRTTHGAYLFKRDVSIPNAGL